MSMQVGIAVGTVVVLILMAGIVLARHRLGELNAASWLVIVGALVIATEHPLFAIAYSVPLPSMADDLRTQTMPLLPHARIHFFMAGIYTLIGLGLLCLVARTMLREGRRAGWFAVLSALLVGGVFDLLVGAQWYQHGSPLYSLFGVQVIGFGWEFLYLYFVAWIAALAVSFRPIFARAQPHRRVVAQLQP